MSVSDWNDYVKRLLKSEMIKRGVSTEELVDLLKGSGVIETKSSIDSKISRGKFSAVFFLQCLQVMGCKNIEVNPPYKMSIAAEPIVKYKVTEDE